MAKFDATACGFIASILQTVGINVSLYSFQEKMGNNIGAFSIIPRLYRMKSFVLNSACNIVKIVTACHLKCRSS